MAIQRIQIAKNKKTAISKHNKREIAQLLGKNKEEMSRIKAEHIIREDFTIEAYEILELLCELLNERIRLITLSKTPPEDIFEAIASIIWASTIVNIPELEEVRSQLAKKYGKKFVTEILEKPAEQGNVRDCLRFYSFLSQFLLLLVVNARLFRKLSVEPPSASLVLNYMVEIAKEYNIDWQPTDIGVPEVDERAAFQSPSGFSIPMAPGTDLRSVYQRPPEPSVNSVSMLFFYLVYSFYDMVSIRRQLLRMLEELLTKPHQILPHSLLLSRLLLPVLPQTNPTSINVSL